jgi:hypothetical protein
MIVLPWSLGKSIDLTTSVARRDCVRTPVLAPVSNASGQ